MIDPGTSSQLAGLAVLFLIARAQHPPTLPMPRFYDRDPADQVAVLRAEIAGARS